MVHFYLGIVLFEGCNQARFCFFGNTVASASADDTIKIWSLDGEELASLVGHGDRVYDLSFSPDGKILVSGSWDFTALLQSAKQENRKVTYATQFRLSKRRKCYSQFFYERARPHFHDALKIQDKETVFPILRLGYIDLTLIKFQHIISSFFFQNSF